MLKRKKRNTKNMKSKYIKEKKRGKRKIEKWKRNTNLNKHIVVIVNHRIYYCLLFILIYLNLMM